MASREISPLRTWALLMRASVRATFAYRGNVVNVFFGSIALQGIQLVFISVLLSRFGSIGGWTYQEIALLFAMRLCSHACCTVPFGQHAAIDVIIDTGDYDRFLLRPANTFIQLITARFNPGSLGDLTLGGAVLVVAAHMQEFEWTSLQVILLFAGIIAGGLVEAGVAIFLSGLAFRLRSTVSLKIMVESLITDFGNYPINIFGQFGSLALTFIVPVAFIAFLPATIILGHAEESFLGPWFAYASLVAGPLWFWSGYRFFMRQSRAYSSPGN